MIKKITRKLFSFFSKVYILLLKFIIKISQKKNFFENNKVIIFLCNNKGNILHNLLKELDQNKY